MEFFFNYFVGNRHPQYSGNLIFLLLALSAIGYGCIFSIFSKIDLIKKLQLRLAVGIIVILISSPLVQALYPNFFHSNKASKKYCYT